MKTVFHIDLGLTDYGYSWDLQKKLNFHKQNNDCPDVIITNEHNPVYTMGRSGNRNHLLIKEDSLKENDISYYEIDRGGDLTYHGPGQLVCYPIFDLRHFYLDIHKYLRDLEEAVIQTLRHYDIDAQRDEGYTGVWAGNEKICAIGIKVVRWVTMHGLALNVNNDLDNFNKIIPCGIFHKGVTSVKELLHREANMEELTALFLKSLESVFHVRTESIGFDKLAYEFNIVENVEC